MVTGCLGQSSHAGAVLCWHLVMTKPANEEFAVAQLQRQGYGTYYPRALIKKMYRGKWRDLVCALFPRYVFIQTDTTRQVLGPVRSTLGVSSIVRFGTACLVVPDHVVASLKNNADPLTGLHTLRTSELFRRGDPVRIAAGSLSGLEGIFESDNGEHRVTVLLNLLGRETRIQVDASCITKTAA